MVVDFLLNNSLIKVGVLEKIISDNYMSFRSEEFIFFVMSMAYKFPILHPPILREMVRLNPTIRV